MRFDFDATKSAANKEKHGIDFVECQRLWNDDRLTVVAARSDDEPRFLAIGIIDGVHWAAVYVERHGRIWIISVRRARRQERAGYEGQRV